MTAKKKTNEIDTSTMVKNPPKKFHHPYDELLRKYAIPTIYCPGCGIGTTIQAFLEAITKYTDIPHENIIVISGIGCTGRASGYINLDGFHAIHGRAIPFASGVEIARPDIKPVIISGDGDLFSIGMGHLAHAARRNIDMTVIVINNSIYGLTGGQDAPTTPVGALTKTTPYGKISYPFNLSQIAIANGATFCARYTVYEFTPLAKAIARGMNHQGFSFIEVISNCHVNFGRRNNLGDAIAMRKQFKKARVRMTEKDINKDWHKTDIEFKVGVGFTKIPTGIFLEEKERPIEFSERIVNAYEIKKS
ncbi:2-oxoacid:ferredoxin oxidoreductase subunit beta [Candidatus Heimdallarchaeota archaeon]|nr:MAG: 2-oxoacid:ferredoxin oxidoreductase subunit beta [Candidatus Gerdarchaeota archaeon]RLI70812.1 MAG: 2-oxoacid:ferredoxin oxidoreductase subunit beta [Candidatus Heimdallarchaeota archaeon]